MKLEILTEINQKIIDRFHQLMRQLCPDCPPLPLAHYQELIAHPTSMLIVAKKEEEIIGCLTLAWYYIPTGTRMWIEDVVVDELFRGQNLGEALIQYAIQIAKSKGARQIDLTSRPSRLAANHLYKKLGFESRETNVYRLKI